MTWLEKTEEEPWERPGGSSGDYPEPGWDDDYTYSD